MIIWAKEKKHFQDYKRIEADHASVVSSHNFDPKCTPNALWPNMFWDMLSGLSINNHDIEHDLYLSSDQVWASPFQRYRANLKVQWFSILATPSIMGGTFK